MVSLLEERICLTDEFDKYFYHRLCNNNNTYIYFANVHIYLTNSNSKRFLAKLSLPNHHYKVAVPGVPETCHCAQIHATLKLGYSMQNTHTSNEMKHFFAVT